MTTNAPSLNRQTETRQMPLKRICLTCSKPFTPTRSRKSRCQPCSTTTNRGLGWSWQKQRTQILQRDHYQCHYCGKPANTIDHKTARNNGGTNHAANLVACCASCNAKKGDQPPSWKP